MSDGSDCSRWHLSSPWLQVLFPWGACSLGAPEKQPGTGNAASLSAMRACLATHLHLSTYAGFPNPIHVLPKTVFCFGREGAEEEGAEEEEPIQHVCVNYGERHLHKAVRTRGVSQRDALTSKDRTSGSWRDLRGHNRLINAPHL